MLYLETSFYIRNQFSLGVRYLADQFSQTPAKRIKIFFFAISCIKEALLLCVSGSADFTG